MTRFERASLAFLTKVMLKELPRDDNAIITNRRWRVEHIGQSEPDRAFTVRRITWFEIEFEDESTRHKMWTEHPIKNKNEGILKNQERTTNDIRIRAINSNDIKVEDSDGSYDIEMTSYDDVEIYSHSTRKRYRFKVVS